MRGLSVTDETSLYKTYDEAKSIVCWECEITLSTYVKKVSVLNIYDRN